MSCTKTASAAKSSLCMNLLRIAVDPPSVTARHSLQPRGRRPWRAATWQSMSAHQKCMDCRAGRHCEEQSDATVAMTVGQLPVHGPYAVCGAANWPLAMAMTRSRRGVGCHAHNSPASDERMPQAQARGPGVCPGAATLAKGSGATVARLKWAIGAGRSSSPKRSLPMSHEPAR